MTSTHSNTDPAPPRRRYRRDDVHGRVARYFLSFMSGKRDVHRRHAHEVIYQLRSAGAVHELADTLAQISTFNALYEDETRYVVLEYWAWLGPEFDSVVMYRRGLDDFESIHGADASTLARLANMFVDNGRLAGALDLRERQLALALASGNSAEEAEARRTYGKTLHLVGEYKAAVDQFQRALPLFRELGDSRGVAATVGYLGGTFMYLGEHARALEQLEEQAQLCRELGDLRGVALASSHLGQLLLTQSRYDEALEHLTAAREIMVRTGNLLDRLMIDVNIGNIHFGRREYTLALESYDRARKISVELGDLVGMALTSGGMGVTYRSLGQLERAHELLTETERIYTEIGDRQGAAIAVGNLGYLHAERGDHQRALESFDRAMAEHRAIGFSHGVANWLPGSADVLLDVLDQATVAPEALLRHLGVRADSDWRRSIAKLARDRAEEGLSLASDLSASGAKQQCAIALARLDAVDGYRSAAVDRLRDLLTAAGTEAAAAPLHYWLWKFGDEESERRHHAAAALRAFDILYDQTPLPRMARRIDELREFIRRPAPDAR